MRAAVKRADNVIRGLLDFSAPRQLEVADASLTEIIEHALLLVRGEMSGKRLQARSPIFSPSLPVLRLDRMKVEQVFVNLITNAIHAMPDGRRADGARVREATHRHGRKHRRHRLRGLPRRGPGVVAEIDDTGTGIPEAKLGKIFDPFYTTKPTGKGTGLGLTVTRSIIDLHGGTIEITNRPEGGARATVMFKV